MKKESESLAFVIANCNFGNHKQFIKELKESSTLNAIGDWQEIKFQSNIELPENFPMPVCGLYADEISIIYIVPEKKVSIEAKKYEEKKETLKKILNAVSNMQIANITAIGINYDVIYNTAKKRLNIFNSSIHAEFPDWEKNVGFKVTIPLDLQERELKCNSFFEIKKHSGGKEKNGEFKEYKYNITANYHFKINSDKAIIDNRLKELKTIIDKIDVSYADFEEKCKKVIKL